MKNESRRQLTSISCLSFLIYFLFSFFLLFFNVICFSHGKCYYSQNKNNFTFQYNEILDKNNMIDIGIDYYKIYESNYKINKINFRVGKN